VVPTSGVSGPRPNRAASFTCSASRCSSFISCVLVSRSIFLALMLGPAVIALEKSATRKSSLAASRIKGNRWLNSNAPSASRCHEFRRAASRSAFPPNSGGGEIGATNIPPRSLTFSISQSWEQIRTLVMSFREWIVRRLDPSVRMTTSTSVSFQDGTMTSAHMSP